jgi:hypothetical protein
MVTPSEIVDELEQDLMTIAVNMSYEVPLSDTKRAIFLRHVEKKVRDLQAVFLPAHECKCKLWIIRDKARGTEEHAVKVKLISEKLKRGRKPKSYYRSRLGVEANVQLPDGAEGAAAQPGGHCADRMVGRQA